MTGDRIAPYETLVRWGVLHDRLRRLSDEIARCADQAAAIVERLSGRFDAAGQPLAARP